MKKTQKIFALVMAVMMIFSCFSMVVMAEEEMITVVSATEISKNEYIVEFSAPVHFHAINQIFRRQLNYTNGTDQQYDKTVEYVGETSDVEGVTYSKTVKITFKDVAPTFNQGKYGLLFAEYTSPSKTEHLGALPPSIITGANGELVKANLTNTEATPLDFVWIPTASLDVNGTYGVRIVNGYEENIQLLSVDVSEDFSTYTCKFSAPVKIAARSYIWLRPNDPNGAAGQVNPTSAEYLGETITYGDDTFSDTVKLTFNPDGGNYQDKTIRESSENFTKYGLDFVEYNNENGNTGFISALVLYGLNGRVVKSNLYEQNNNRDFLWVPTYAVDTKFAYKTHLNFGAPYVVSALRLTNGNTIRVEFNEPVAYTGGIWDIIMRDSPEVGTNQANLANATPAVSGTTVTVDGVTYGTILEFKHNNIDAISADGAFGMTFCEYNDAAHAQDGFVTAKHIKDVDGNGLTATYSNAGNDFVWIPTDGADTGNAFPVHLEKEYVPEVVNVATYDELVNALNKYAKTTIKVTADLVANEGVTYEYDEASGKALVVDGEGTVIAAYGTGKQGTVAGQLIEGSIEDLAVWTPFNVKNNVVDFQGHKVSGWVLGASGNRYGIFDAIDATGTVKNINVENVFTCVNGVASARVGAFAAQNWGTVENVNVKDAIIIVANCKSANVGMVAGYMSSSKTAQKELFNSTIYNATATGYLFYSANEGSPCIGGVVGKLNGGKIVNCVNYASVIQTGTASYGTGGLVGLIETQAGGPFAADTDFSKKNLEHMYVVNNANYGTVDVTAGMWAGGLVGYADAIWSAGSSVIIANNFNGAKVIGGKSGIVARSQNTSSLGSITAVYEFNFDDAANDNVIIKIGATFAAKAVRVSTQADALENLNRNAGNYQKVNNENYAAWAWKQVGSKILPDKDTALSEVKDATPTVMAPTTYNPETEIYITNVRLVNPAWVEVTFSEPVVLAEGANVYAGLRYVETSLGVPNLIQTKIDADDTVDPAQFDAAAKNFYQGKLYVRIGDNGRAVSNTIEDKLNGTAFSDEKVKEDAVVFCIEGATGTIPGYVDEITSIDGTKKLKASAGKSNAGGKYDGVYFEIENEYEDSDFVNANLKDDNVVLESAEIAGPHALKLNFSEPVELLEGTRAWLSLRYCKYSADGKTFGYMTYKEGEADKPAQVGVTISKIECDEDGGFIVNLGNGVDILELISGDKWEGEDFVAISIEQLPDQIEGQGSIGYLDNIVAVADNTKKLASSPMKVDISYNKDADEYGPYDGAYAYILEHEHAFNTPNFDEENHWVECICGLVDEDSFATHEFDEDDIKCDAENHWIECECGAKYGETAHEYDVPEFDAENHWNECICGTIDEESVTAHSFDKPQSDAENHWANCECGAEGEKTAHEYTEAKFDADHHWNECECGADDGKVVHDYNDGDTCECGAKKYIVGDVDGDEDVDANDAIYLLYHIFFFEETGDYAVNQPINYNSDSAVDANDAIYLLYHVFFFEESGDYPLFPEVELQ